MLATRYCSFTLALLLPAALTVACSNPPGEPSDGGDGEALVDGLADLTGDIVADDASAVCACSPGLHNDRIFVVSDDGELWNYEPAANAFALVASMICGGGVQPFSMAVDERGTAWILDVTSRRIYTLDVNEPGGCVDSGYRPGSVFGLFGMAFTGDGPGNACTHLYAFSYSGSGPFREGPGLGALGVLDPDTMELRRLGPLDFDGGELAGTRSGRLFGFGGALPAKVLDLDKSDATVLDMLSLDGFAQTSAAAFAFFGGDAYLFTEAPPAGCEACFDTSCPGVWDSCRADPVCSTQLDCALETGDVTDECGGGMSAEALDCLARSCGEACLLSPRARVSRVTRLDHDASDSPDRDLVVLVPEAPIRVVGAGTSPCVPEVPL
ncbi:MAG: hypothetical protein HY825_02240 [Acidobacteria bacterium]|nr:hypothetical protein [Acidobacteriota bacterium]